MAADIVGSIKGNRLDDFMDDRDAAILHGRQRLRVVRLDV